MAFTYIEFQNILLHMVCKTETFRYMIEFQNNCLYVKQLSYYFLDNNTMKGYQILLPLFIAVGFDAQGPLGTFRGNPGLPEGGTKWPSMPQQ